MPHNKTSPFVSIILVNYNGAEDTIDCVESIEKQEYKNYEIIVVDNCSTDDSLDKISQLQDRVILLTAKENNGFSAGNNIGIEYAINHGADYVLLLNNDTVVSQSFLTEMIMEAYCRPTAVITGTIYYEKKRQCIWYAGGSFSEVTARTCHWNIGSENAILPKEAKEVTFISGCEMLIPKSVIEIVGMLDEDYFLYAEDIDYCARTRRAGFSLVYVPSSVIYHKVSASTSKISYATQYYSVRNRRILIHKNLKSLKRVSALICSDIQTIRRLLDGRLTMNAVKAGIVDYYKGKTGKLDRTLNTKYKEFEGYTYRFKSRKEMHD